MKIVEKAGEITAGISGKGAKGAQDSLNPEMQETVFSASSKQVNRKISDF